MDAVSVFSCLTLRSGIFTVVEIMMISFCVTCSSYKLYQLGISNENWTNDVKIEG